MMYRDFWKLKLLLLCLLSFHAYGEDETISISTEVETDYHSDIVCPVAYETLPIEQKIVQITNSTLCYQDKKSFTRDVSYTDKELLLADQQVCGCLRNSSASWVQEIMNRKRIQSSDFSLRPYIVNSYERELANVLNGMTFQASSLSLSSLGPQPTEMQKVGAMEEIASLTAPLYDDNRGEEERLKVVVEDEPIKLSYSPKYDLMVDEAFKDERQCISSAEFFTRQQFPTGIALAELTSSGPEIWNYKEMEKRYYEIMSKSSSDRTQYKDEIAGLKSKLIYLNRNPMIKYFMASPVASDAKKTLFGLMQKMSNPDCRVLFTDCLNSYKSDLNKFFRNPDYAKILRAEAAIDHKSRSERRINLPPEKDPSKLTQKFLVDQFQRNFKMPSPDECQYRDAEEKNISIDADKELKCLNIYSAYCSVLEQRSNEISIMENVSRDLADTLDEELADDYNTDFSSNEEFRKFNEEFCSIKRKKWIGFDLTADIREFKKDYCSGKNTKLKECYENNAGSWVILREKFAQKYTRVTKDNLDPAMRHAYSGKSLPSFSSDVISQVFRNTSIHKDPIGSYRESIARNDLNNKTLAPTPLAGDQSPGKVNGQPLDNGSGLGQAGTVAPAPPMFNYSSNLSEAALPAPERVENLNKEKRKDLLRDLEKDYDQWKDDKGDSLSGAEMAEAKRREEEIKTLKDLLSQQQQLNMEQTKLLNQAIARNKTESRSREDQADEREESARKASTATAKTSNDDVVRAPASIKDDSIGTSAAMAQKSKIPSARVSKNGKSASEASSADSILREEMKAKMVNVQRQVDGSITVVTSSGVVSSGNAITLAVTDEQYKMLVANPAGLNLSQIQNRIPAEQIAKLEQNGEITLLLSNGANPPFEVKVEKKDNRLVYSLKDKNGNDQLPVKPVRVHNLEALRSTIGIGRK